MPLALKKYMEVELFPWIQMKVSKGISISMASQWLQHEGYGAQEGIILQWP